MAYRCSHQQDTQNSRNVGRLENYIAYREELLPLILVTLEYFDKLHKAGVGFVSISEQMDFSTPTGQVFLAMVGAFSQFYSDNLSHETKKGWAERRAQGLYCGLLPFGVMKGEDGVPVPDPETIDGLHVAFDLAAKGHSDREIAQALTTRGFRTAGNQGNRAFSKDTIRGLLTNRFYVGEIPDGKGGWLTAQQERFASQEAWDEVQLMRARNRKSSHGSTTNRGKRFSLTGVTYCWRCKGRIHVTWSVNGQVRLGCYNRAKGWACDQPSAPMQVYESQLREYLATFCIPENYHAQILDANRKLDEAYGAAEKERGRLQAQVHRLRELYEWGDLAREEYVLKRDTLEHQLRALTPATSDGVRLDRLAAFLADVVKAWDAATQEQRNKLVRCLFEEIWLEGKSVVAVRPVDEFEPFFRLNYKDWLRENNNELATPRGIGVPSN